MVLNQNIFFRTIMYEKRVFLLLYVFHAADVSSISQKYSETTGQVSLLMYIFYFTNTNLTSTISNLQFHWGRKIKMLSYK